MRKRVGQLDDAGGDELDPGSDYRFGKHTPEMEVAPLHKQSSTSHSACRRAFSDAKPVV